MIKKIIFLFLFLFFLVLVQASFFGHFSVKGSVFNFYLLTIILICLFSRERDFAIASALIGGFYLDIFSLGKTGFFGFYTLALLSLAFFIRLVIRKYVQFPIFKRVQKQKNPFYV
ncbi:MAG: rod shape-determining protein MreD [Parcubacteria group bacterium]|nr:MAG: rod shape-determining protein MreD [Parcubacteria group bacterium]